MYSLEDVRVRKSGLTQRIAAQRLSLGTQIHDLQPLFHGADRGLAAVKAVAAAWPWIALAGSLLFVRKLRAPSRLPATRRASGSAMIWLRRGLLAWRAWSLVQQALLAHRGRTRQRQARVEMSSTSRPGKA